MCHVERAGAGPYQRCGRVKVQGATEGRKCQSCVTCLLQVSRVRTLHGGWRGEDWKHTEGSELIDNFIKKLRHCEVFVGDVWHSPVRTRKEMSALLCCVVLLYKCKVYPLLFLLAGWATKCMARHSQHVVHWFVPALAGGLFLRIIFFSICRLNIHWQLIRY